MQNANSGEPKLLQGHGLRIGLVQARFNAPLTDSLAQFCLRELQALGVRSSDCIHVTVPGALEIPLALQCMARQDASPFDALIGLGCIIRGETYHFELVANESGAGITRVSLDHHIPIANAILTIENEAQALARVQNKGRDAARVAIDMAQLMKELL
jgi:6,7-dimethyl-8-ribityllumazine synthase